MGKLPHAMMLAAVCALSACVGPHTQAFLTKDGTLLYFDPAKDPYWQNPAWTAALFRAVQSAVQEPGDPADTTTHGAHAKVKFTYADGVIEYPDIVESTGNPDLDKLMLHQVASVQPPVAAGLRADETHEFVTDLDMPTPFEAFQSGIYSAIDAQKVYPKDAVIGGAGGVNAVDFDYLDGSIAGITLVQSSKNKDLDKASVNAVTKAVMPPVPAAYAGKARHMEAIFCYSLDGSERIGPSCPAALNVIFVTGTRIRRVGF